VGLTAGKRLRAQNSTTEVVVIKGTDGDVALLCGGVEMVAGAPAADVPALDSGEVIELGKRYTDPAEEIEVLCSRAGLGPLTVGGRPLAIKPAKALPASD
jgi:hypothetical protein